MEIVLIVIGVLIVLAFLEKLVNRFRSINWGKFFGVLIIGGVLLAAIFSFTAEGVLVIVGAYCILVIFALVFGAFSNNASSETHEQGAEKDRCKIAVNLLDVLDDETIASKTELSIDEVKTLRLKNSG